MNTGDKIISWDKFYEDITNSIDADLCKKYEPGIKTHLEFYVEKKYPDAISEKNGQILIDKGILLGIDKELNAEDFSEEYRKKLEDFRKEYFEKTEKDYSASEITTHLFDYKGVPPIDTMSPESLERLILSLFNTERYKS